MRFYDRESELNALYKVPQEILIRPAGADDIEAIARVHIQSWHETYPGIMPQQRLDSLSMERSTKHWQANISGAFTVLVAELDGRIVGFLSGGDNSEYQACETGLGNACDCELGALYLLQEFHGRGIGKALFNRFVELMQQDSRRTMIVWVAEKNRSTGFYTAMGGELVDRKILTVCEVPVPVLGYKYVIEV
jgi:GNAT superfamily N-acetyltransferase